MLTAVEIPVALLLLPLVQIEVSSYGANAGFPMVWCIVSISLAFRIVAGGFFEMLMLGMEEDSKY